MIKNTITFKQVYSNFEIAVFEIDFFGESASGVIDIQKKTAFVTLPVCKEFVSNLDLLQIEEKIKQMLMLYAIATEVI